MKTRGNSTAWARLLLGAFLAAGLSACGGFLSHGDYDDPQRGADGHGPSLIRWDILEITFPVVGGTTKFYNDWHASRAGGARAHLGTDVMAKKMTPVVAVAAGVVAWVRAKKGGECCYLAIDHESQGRRFQSRYLHLNNDTPGTDDGKKIGIAKGIRKGVKVQAGQLIGWVGDSGNAEGTAPHLHFELRDEYYRAVNPYLLLKRARRIPRAISVTTRTAEEQDDFETR